MKTRFFALLLACSLAFAVYVQASAADNHRLQARFKVGNIRCGACANSVKAALLALPGVQTATIGSDHLARISYDSLRVRWFGDGPVPLSRMHRPNRRYRPIEPFFLIAIVTSGAAVTMFGVVAEEA